MLQRRVDRALTVPLPGGPLSTGFPDHGGQMMAITRSDDPHFGGDVVKANRNAAQLGSVPAATSFSSRQHGEGPDQQRQRDLGL
jgi:hypothetical protein